MKKRLLLICSIIMVITVVILVINIIKSYKTPDLIVHYQNTEVEVQKCPLSWDTFLMKTRWDYPEPSELAKHINMITVEPESTLTFFFQDLPDSFKISIWKNNSSDEQMKSNILDVSKDNQSENNIIKVPKEQGIYVYSVIGHWKKGQIVYVFKIKVK